MVIIPKDYSDLNFKDGMILKNQKTSKRISTYSE